MPAHPNAKRGAIIEHLKVHAHEHNSAIANRFEVSESYVRKLRRAMKIPNAMDCVAGRRYEPTVDEAGDITVRQVVMMRW